MSFIGYNNEQSIVPFKKYITLYNTFLLFGWLLTTITLERKNIFCQRTFEISSVLFRNFLFDIVPKISSVSQIIGLKSRYRNDKTRTTKTFYNCYLSQLLPTFLRNYTQTLEHKFERRRIFFLFFFLMLWDIQADTIYLGDYG